MCVFDLPPRAAAASIHLFQDSMESLNVWSSSADHRRCRWRRSQRCYLWLGSALTSGRLLAASEAPLPRPPLECDKWWDLGGCISFLHAVRRGYKGQRIWDTAAADRGHSKYRRCVWFTLFRGLFLPSLFIKTRKKKCCSLYKVIRFCSSVRGKRWYLKQKNGTLCIFQCS